MYKIKISAPGKPERFLTNKNKRVQHYLTKEAARKKIESSKRYSGARIVDASGPRKPRKVAVKGRKGKGKGKKVTRARKPRNAGSRSLSNVIFI
jgi:hypothetical protein